MAKCLPQGKRCLSGWLLQIACHVCTWHYDNPLRPMYLKTLDTFWQLFPKFSSANTLVLDVSLYRMYFNDLACYLILLELEKQTEVQWESFLKDDVATFVLQWAESNDRAKTVKECPLDIRNHPVQQSRWRNVQENIEQKKEVKAPMLPKKHSNPTRWKRPQRAAR